MNDCDWMAGETLEECKAEYLKNYYFDGEEDAFDSPHELTPDQLKRYKFHGEPDEPSRGVRSFEEELLRLLDSGATFPRFFASTEY
jgi:hypothetical protein